MPKLIRSTANQTAGQAAIAAPAAIAGACPEPSIPGKPDPFYLFMQRVVEMERAFGDLATCYHVEAGDRKEADEAFSELLGCLNNLSYQVVQGNLPRLQEADAAAAACRGMQGVGVLPDDFETLGDRQ